MTVILALGVDRASPSAVVDYGLCVTVCLRDSVCQCVSVSAAVLHISQQNPSKNIS